MTPFIVYGLPRSRTYWLSRFLTYGDWTCGHEETRHFRTIEDIKSWAAQPCIGTAETGAAPWWRLADSMFPDMPVVVVRRPVDQVLASLANSGLSFDRPAMARNLSALDRKLDQIKRRVPNAISVQFSDLANEATCAKIFEHCLPYKHDPAWWSLLSPMNLQINLPALLRYYAAYRPQINKISSMAKQRIISGMSRRTRDIDGITIQEEPFGTFYRDGKAQFAEHLVQVGEAPEAMEQKNIPLMRTLENIGCLQVMTARCNGRMFGYLMAVISPSLESPDTTSAVHTIFFASKEFPGLGMKLQKASIAALREKGVNEVFLRAGTRGSGPKMGSLYKRLGAEDHGQFFVLKLEAA